MLMKYEINSTWAYCVFQYLLRDAIVIMVSFLKSTAGSIDYWCSNKDTVSCMLADSH